MALQGLAAVLGGCQSLHTNSMDEAWALPSEKAALLALRTQQIIAEETGVTSTVDPLGGSYYLETLTRQMEAAAYDYFRRIEDVGGVIRATESGFMQREIADAAYGYQQEMDRGELITVEINAYTGEDSVEIPLLRVDAKGRRRQVERLAEVRARLGELEQAARGSDNLMPYILDSVRAYATLGEVTGVLREVFGEYRPRWEV